MNSTTNDNQLTLERIAQHYIKNRDGLMSYISINCPLVVVIRTPTPNKITRMKVIISYIDTLNIHPYYNESI